MGEGGVWEQEKELRIIEYFVVLVHIFRKKTNLCCSLKIFKNVPVLFNNIFSQSPSLTQHHKCLSRILAFCLSVNYEKAIGCQPAVPSYHLWGSWVSVLYLQKQMALMTLSPNDMALNLSQPCRSTALRNMPVDACELAGVPQHFSGEK